MPVRVLRMFEDPEDFAVPNQLCQTCRRFCELMLELKISPDRRSEQFSHSSFHDLQNESVARDACHLCSLILGAVLKECYILVPEAISVALAFSSTKDWKGAYYWNFYIRILLLNSDDSQVNFKSKVYVSESYPKLFDSVNLPVSLFPDIKLYHNHFSDIPVNKVSALAEAARLSVSTGSQSSCQLMRSWITDCREKHTTCNPKTEHEPILPSRLIAVEATVEGRIRLRLVTPVRKGFRYLALSHCWGTGQPYRLTTQNVASFVKTINFDDLPLTFQHAVLLTQRLYFEYIWIDSLCIIQDSEEDWFSEAAKMGAIYRNAACRIAASSARNCEEGLFRFRRPLLRTPVFHQLSHDSYVHIEQDSSLKDKETETLLERRAWVIQESRLSMSTISFEDDEIVWKCFESTFSNSRCSDNDAGRYLAFSNITTPKMSQFDEYLLSDSKHPLQNHRDMAQFANGWSALLESYTACDLTFASDRLVAISGIIEILQTSTAMTCVFGIWRQMLIDDLLWTVVRWVTPSSPLRAPTWSWASNDAAISRTLVSEPDGQIVRLINAATEQSIYYFAEATFHVDKRIIALTVRIWKIESVQCNTNITLKGFGSEYNIPHWIIQDARGVLSQVTTDDGRTPAQDMFLLPLIKTSVALRRRNLESLESRGLELQNHPSALECDHGLLIQPVPARDGYFTRIGRFKTYHDFLDRHQLDPCKGLESQKRQVIHLI